MKVNPVLQEGWADIKAWFEDYKQSSPRIKWAKLVMVLSAMALLIDFLIFCVFVAAVGASWGVVIALYYDMLANALGMLFSANLYIMMSFVILRIFAVLGFAFGDAYWTYLSAEGTTEVIFQMSLTTWLIIFSVTSVLYTIYSVRSISWTPRYALEGF